MSENVQFRPSWSIWANISETVHAMANVSVNTYTKSYIIFQFTLRTSILDDLYRSNIGHRTFNRLHLILGTSYDQSFIKHMYVPYMAFS